ncbi:MAG: hypothetical protein GY715_07415 [Planctomycetes bacterium]|nr:hypothetical protein [Planctomycetota bacterium]
MRLTLAAAVLSAVVFGEAEGPATSAAPPLPAADGRPALGLRRMIRRFDFEEAQTTRLDFPPHFSRVIAEDRGFPKFGRMQLTRDVAHTGQWSLAFELDGGSLAVEIPTGVLPVLPMADYIVSVMVRTGGLQEARVRLVATLHDGLGAPIPGSRAISRATRTGGSWEMLTASLPGDFPDAAHLRVELELLQPHHLADTTDTSRPVVEDVHGSAWFDDVTIWHIPRLELSTNAENNIVVLPEHPTLDVLVHDLSGDPLTAHLRIEDISGAAVYEESFPAPQGRHPMSIEVPLDTAGWYRAVLNVEAPDAVAGRREQPFVVLPPREASPIRPAETLAVVLPFAPAGQLEQLGGVIPDLHGRGAVVSIWDAALSTERAAERFRPMRKLVEQLLETDIDLTFALEAVPREIARSNGVNPEQVLELLNQDPSHWRPWLDEMLINFGLRVRRWQLGGTQFPDAFWKANLQRLSDGAERALGQFIPRPTIIIPFSADQEIPETLDLPAVHVTIPHEVHPSMLPAYAEPWRSAPRQVFVSFDLLPPDEYAPRQQVVDLALRTLWGWRTELEQMAITAPWTWEGARDEQFVPEPAYAAWRGLADGLRGRTFAGEVPVGNGVQCWLMRGDGAAEDAIVIWSDQHSGDTPTTASLVLAEQEVLVVDIFGNRRPLETTDGVHEVPVTDLPVFVEHIDLPLAQFRAGFAIEPAFVASKHRVHDAQLVLHNPWQVGISGRIHLHETADCRIKPRSREFALRAGETVRLPVTIVFDRSIIAGPKRLDADVQLSAGRDHNLRVHTELNVGWREIEHSASWTLALNATTGTQELIISQAVTNRGDRVLHLDAFVVARGVGQNRRVIASLQPGATAIKTFRIPGDASEFAGRRFRVGVSERGGIAQLNRIVTIPEFVGAAAPATAGADDADASPR